MSTFYSPSKKGFFDSSLFKTLPTDAVAISDDQHAALMAAQAKGQSIAADDKGNPIAVAPPVKPAAVPAQVTAFQARAALHAMPGKTAPATLLDDVDAAVTAAAVANPVAALAWEYATVITRGGQFVASISAALGLTSDQVDAVFTAASKIAA